jgi:hypothetical protein
MIDSFSPAENHRRENYWRKLLEKITGDRNDQFFACGVM